jgi:outer membrane protein assembly factor BamB
MNLALVAVVAAQAAAGTPASLTPADLAGAWSGNLSHDGEAALVGLELEPGDDGKALIRLSFPLVQMRHVALGRGALKIEGNQVRFGPFSFECDGAAHTLSGVYPEELLPIYEVPVTLHHVPSLDLPARPEPKAPLAEAAWTFDAGSPLWPGTSFAGGLVYAGAEDGRLHALDAATGKERWSFAAGGAIRARAVVGDGALYVQADDGVLYALGAADGKERWRVRVVEHAIVRLPPGDPKSRFDRFGSDVTIADGRLYLGTHDGRVLALAPAAGRVLWSFASGDSVLAAPAVADGRVYFGSFDGNAYALDAATGKLLWKRDTGKPVVSTPAIADDRLIVGSRSYDLLGLDATSGAIAWKRYIWASWVESSAVVRDGIAYVGSSDAAALYAFDARTGKPEWKTDVWGWAWGQPAVTAKRVYMTTSGMGGYPVPHRAGVYAVDRATGQPVWRFGAQPAQDQPYGFVGSPSLGAGRVYAAGLDGRVYAFAE